MWIVRNKLRAVMKIEGTQVEIGPDQEIDLDRFGRQQMDELLPLAVAFEEGYLENVFKSPEETAHEPQPSRIEYRDGVSEEALDQRLDAFKQSFFTELKKNLEPKQTQVSETVLSALISEQIGSIRDELQAGVKGVMDSIEVVQSRLSAEKARIVENRGKLSDAEVRARLAFIEESERTLKKNFEKIGQEITSEGEDQSVMDNADLLSNI